MPEDSVLGPLLFYINFISSLFLEFEDDNINSYADYTTPCSYAEDMPSGITELKGITKKNLRCCENSHMKTNLEKYQVLLSSNIQRFVPFDNAQITSSLSEKLLGITFFLELKLRSISAKFLL